MHRFGYCFITAFGVWLALWLMFIGAHFLGQPTLEIQLHNTYLVVGSYSGQFFTFLPVLLFILLLDAGRRWAARSATVTLACGLSSGLLLCQCVSLGHTYSTLAEAQRAILPLSAAVSSPMKAIWAVAAFLLLVVVWAAITFWRLRAARAR